MNQLKLGQHQHRPEQVGHALASGGRANHAAGHFASASTGGRASAAADRRRRSLVIAAGTVASHASAPCRSSLSRSRRWSIPSLQRGADRFAPSDHLLAIGPAQMPAAAHRRCPTTPASGPARPRQRSRFFQSLRSSSAGLSRLRRTAQFDRMLPAGGIEGLAVQRRLGLSSPTARWRRCSMVQAGVAVETNRRKKIAAAGLPLANACRGCSRRRASWSRRWPARCRPRPATGQYRSPRVLPIFTLGDRVAVDQQHELVVASKDGAGPESAFRSASALYAAGSGRRGRSTGALVAPNPLGVDRRNGPAADGANCRADRLHHRRPGGIVDAGQHADRVDKLFGRHPLDQRTGEGARRSPGLGTPAAGRP